MPSQTDAGKAFEYALLRCANEIISPAVNVIVEENSSFYIAENCFNLYSPVEQAKYIKAATAAINHIVILT